MEESVINSAENGDNQKNAIENDDIQPCQIQALNYVDDAKNNTELIPGVPETKEKIYKIPKAENNEPNDTEAGVDSNQNSNNKPGQVRDIGNSSSSVGDPAEVNSLEMQRPIASIDSVTDTIVPIADNPSMLNIIPVLGVLNDTTNYQNDTSVNHSPIQIAPVVQQANIFEGLSVEEKVALLFDDSKNSDSVQAVSEDIQSFGIPPGSELYNLINPENEPLMEDQSLQTPSGGEDTSSNVGDGSQESKQSESVETDLSDDKNNYKFIATSTEDLIKVCDEQLGLLQNIPKHRIENKKQRNHLDSKNSSLNSINSQNINSQHSAPVMNNLQLLAILEGTDQPDKEGQTRNVVEDTSQSGNAKTIIKKRKNKGINLDPELEKSLALKQLKEFIVVKRKPIKRKSQIVDVKIPKVEKPFLIKKEIIRKDDTSIILSPKNVQTPENCDPLRKESAIKTYGKKAASDDISDLMADWADDEGKPDSTIEDAGDTESSVLDSSVVPVQSVDIISPVTDKRVGDNLKVADVNDGPRRVSRIIKKKVIYDPDNPATHKYASSMIRKDTSPETSSGSVGKMKPPLKVYLKPKPGRPKLIKNLPSSEDGVDENNKLTNIVSPKRKKNILIINSGKKKKKTEVDRLLMDEGAVNMIYQLARSNNDSEVPELILKPNKNSLISISKEKKNMVSRAKIIKKAVFSHSKLDDQKAAKVFRVRKEGKAVSRTDTLTPRNSVGQRSSMQSPSLSELSTAGADESRIIRRHSSSSFSSGCLSPRPQSPTGDSFGLSMESLTESSVNNESSAGENQIHSSTPVPKVFGMKKGNVDGLTSPILNRRGRSVRQKKINETDNSNSKTQLSSPPAFKTYTQLSVEVEDNVSCIVVRPTENSKELYDLQVMRELADAVRVAGAAGGAVLLTSASGGLCGGLDLRCVLQAQPSAQRNAAKEVTEAFRELVESLCTCRGPLVIGVGGACAGAGVSLLVLADLVLASDRATFCAALPQRRQLPPEGASLLARANSIPPQLSRELVLCGRKLTASEALQRGLVARTLWPDRFLQELQSISADLANQPIETFEVMKSVLRRGDAVLVRDVLQHEAKLLTDFWCSPVGQSAIRETHQML